MNEVKPVTIPREVADAIETLRDPETGHAFSNAEIVSVALKTGGGLHRDTVALQKIPFDTLLTALVNGYERELTEEEAREKALSDIRANYTWYDAAASEESRMFNGDPTRHMLAMYAIRDTLNTLGIDIPGVNIPEGGAA